MYEIYEEMASDESGIANENFVESAAAENSAESGGIPGKVEETEDPLTESIEDEETSEEPAMVRRKMINVFILGAAFMFIFAGFLTAAATSETIMRLGL